MEETNEGLCRSDDGKSFHPNNENSIVKITCVIQKVGILSTVDNNTFDPTINITGNEQPTDNNNNIKSSSVNQAELGEKIGKLCKKQSSKKYLQDDYGLYIPPSATIQQFSKQSFDLTGAVNDFIEGDQRVMLLLGESGTGKSFFGQSYIMRESARYTSGDRIPLFISLPSLRKPKTHLMEEALGVFDLTPPEIEALRSSHQFLLIFDAYDEINLFENLYITNKMHEWDAKIIVTCRPSYLAQEGNYRRYFMPFEKQKPLVAAFQELFVAPFVQGQIDQYIKQYLVVKQNEIKQEILLHDNFTQEWLKPDIYLDWIGKIPGLQALSQKPFLLRITMDVLPEVVTEFQSVQESGEKFSMTQARLYDAFIKHWFVRQENKLISTGQTVGRRFQKDCLVFSKALAKKMHSQNLMVVYYEDASTLDDMFGDSDEDSAEDCKEWAMFFSDAMIPADKNNQEKQEARIRARKACPLKQVGENQYGFMHASLRDYFFTLTIVGPRKRNQQPMDGNINNNIELPQQLPESDHRFFGRFALLNKLNRHEADDLFREEGVSIAFDAQSDKKSVVLGQGNFGKFRIARNIVNNRFAGVKKIRGKNYIAESKREAAVQAELTGLPNIMPIWKSGERNGKNNVLKLYQFMPLAGFGDGDQLKALLQYVVDEKLKQKFLIHIAKSLLVGLKGMHNRQVYHLDIKPGNFVLDCSGTLYIIDFGCAKRHYTNEAKALFDGGDGDTGYFAPDRMAYLRHKYVNDERRTGPASSVLKNYDGEKCDVWAVGVSLLELMLEIDAPIKGMAKPIFWRINHWDEAFFKARFQQIDGWSDAVENSLMHMVQQLLITDREKRLTAKQALRLPIFNDKNLQMSQKDARSFMSKLITCRNNPPQNVDEDMIAAENKNNINAYSGQNVDESMVEMFYESHAYAKSKTTYCSSSALGDSLMRGGYVGDEDVSILSYNPVPVFEKNSKK